MGKIWVIPDTHGCFKTLRLLIENLIIPSKEDPLYFLGDYIDRGPDSKGIIDYLIKLKEDGYLVHCLKGNHEENLIRVYDWEQKNFGMFSRLKRSMYMAHWSQFGGGPTLDSFGVKDFRGFPKKYVEWFRQLHNYIELDDYLLVHAGFNFKIDNPMEDTHAMFWLRQYSVIPEKIKNKMVIHGHVATSLEKIKAQINKEDAYRIGLDNGVYLKNKEGLGSLCALELSSKELFVQKNLDL